MSNTIFLKKKILVSSHTGINLYGESLYREQNFLGFVSKSYKYLIA